MQLRALRVPVIQELRQDMFASKRKKKKIKQKNTKSCSSKSMLVLCCFELVLLPWLSFYLNDECR